MTIDGFIWIDTFVDKIQRKHSIEPDEVEEVFKNKPSFKRGPRGHRPGELCLFFSFLRKIKKLL
jgi:hypothetical protein